MYSTLDAIDGKHARKTQQSTPLGALFDHGCDALAIFFEGLAFQWILRRRDADLPNHEPGIIDAGNYPSESRLKSINIRFRFEIEIERLK
jgi:hypothetical protein